VGRPDILLVYDAQCPLCDAYCRMVRIRRSVGELRLIDARQNPAVLREITRAGLDIDEGMVLRVGEALYYGADAIQALALMSTASGVFNRLNHWAFRAQARATWLYPLLSRGRNLLLHLLGRSRINNLRLAGNSRF
jgi:hypothetical protein